MTTRDRNLLGGLGRGLLGRLGDGALARLLALRLPGGRLDDLRRRGLALDGGLGLLGGDDGLGGGRRGVGVLGEGGGRHGLRRRVSSRAWWSVEEVATLILRTGGIRRAAAGRRFVACGGKRGQNAARRCAAAAAGACRAGALRYRAPRRAPLNEFLAPPAFAARRAFLRGAKAWGGFLMCVGSRAAGAVSCGVLMCVYTGADKRRSGRVEGPLLSTRPHESPRCTDATPLKDALRDLETRLGPRAGWSTATPVDRTTKG